MVSEVVATCLRGCEKTVNTTIAADFSRTQKYVIVTTYQTHFHAVIGWVCERVDWTHLAPEVGTIILGLIWLVTTVDLNPFNLSPHKSKRPL